MTIKPKRAEGAEAGLTRAVLELCNGERSVQEIAALVPGAPPLEQVFAVLDRLADARLLSQRVAPPVGSPAPAAARGLDRVRGRAAFGLASAGAALVAAGSAAAQDAEQQSKQATEEKAKAAEKDKSDTKPKGPSEQSSKEAASKGEQDAKDLAAEQFDKQNAESMSKMEASEAKAKALAGSDEQSGKAVVPVPPAGLMMATGLVGLAAWREMRVKKKPGEDGEGS